MLNKFLDKIANAPARFGIKRRVDGSVFHSEYKKHLYEIARAGIINK